MDKAPHIRRALGLLVTVCLLADMALASTEAQVAAEERLLSHRSRNKLAIGELQQLVDLVISGGETESELGQRLSGLSDLNAAHCTADHFWSLIHMMGHYSKNLVADYLTEVIKKQRAWCKDYLEQATQSIIDKFKPETREYFSLILKHDQIGSDFYLVPQNSIAKLRQIVEDEGIETSEQFKIRFGVRFFSACLEINHLNKLEPIRQSHKLFARFPPSCNKYFRANNFCKNLVDLDPLRMIDEALIRDVRMRSDFNEFGRYLKDKKLPSEAALEYAFDYVQATNERDGSRNKASRSFSPEQYGTARKTLYGLRSTCESVVHLLDNILWLADFAGVKLEGFVADRDQTQLMLLRKYLKTAYACRQVQKINIDTLLKEHQRRISSATKCVCCVFSGRFSHVFRVLKTCGHQ